MDVVSGLREAGVKDVTAIDAVRKMHSRDQSPADGSTPIAVIRPANVGEVQNAMEFCNAKRIGVTVRGGGSSLSGASIPGEGGIAMDMSRLNRILEVNIEDRYVVAEPGVTLDTLDKRLARSGYFYPPDPASSAFATVGGTISTNAGGLRAVRYGTTKEWVLGLEVVLPTGEVIRTGGKTQKRSIGYDLTGLMIASEGTLGVVTKATLKIWPVPESISLVTGYYRSISDAGKSIEELNKSGMKQLAAEFIDRKSMDFMSARSGVRYPAGARYMLFIEVATTRESIGRMSRDTASVLKKRGAFGVSVATAHAKIERLYAARKRLFIVMKEEAERAGKRLMITDVVVPISELPGAMGEMEEAREMLAPNTAIFGHIGDGNLHANVAYDRGNHGDVAMVEKLQREFGMIAIRRGGSVSGEHGIGLLKKELLVEEFRIRGTPGSVALMRRIKKAFDPKGILNRGKIFD